MSGMTVAQAPARAARPGRRQRLAQVCDRSGVLAVIERLRRAPAGELRILAYHRVLEALPTGGFSFDLELVSATAASFRQQVAWLASHMQPMRLDEVLALVDAGRPLPPRAVVITFDDGYDDNYRVAYPILRESGVPAVFFVSTAHVESGLPFAYDWLVHMVCSTGAAVLEAPELDSRWILPEGIDARRRVAADVLDTLKRLDARRQIALVSRLEAQWRMPRAPHPNCRPMDWAQLREMSGGGMEIGSHGMHHLMLAKLPQRVLEAELYGSRRALQRELGVPAQVLSYPVGGVDSYDARVLAAARRAGYRMACTYLSGAGRVVGGKMFELSRLPVERGVDIGWFRAMLSFPRVFGYRSPVRAG